MKNISEISSNESEKTKELSKLQIEIKEIPDSHIKWLFKIVMKQKFVTFYVIFGSILAIVFTMARLYITGQLFDIITIYYKNKLQYSIEPSFITWFSDFEINRQILSFIIIILLLGIGGFIFNISVNVLNELLAQRTERDIREEFYRSIQNKSMTFHDTTKVGDLMSKATYDVRIINATVSPGIRMIVRLVITACFAMGLIFYYDWRIGIILVCLVPFYVWRVRIYSQKIKPLTEAVQKQFGDCNALLQENVSGVRVIRAFTAEKHETKKFKNEIDKLQHYIKERGTQRALYFPPLILTIGIAIALGLSAIFIYQGTLTVGQAITINGSLIQLYDPTYQISWVLYLSQMGLAGAKRIVSTMKEEEIIYEKPSAINLETIQGKVEFRDVDFSYYKLQQKRLARNLKRKDLTEDELQEERERVEKLKEIRATLKDINFVAQPGKIIAILGPTGSGKSTLTKLIARMYDVDSGEILIDDVNINDITLQSLRENIGVIEQDIFLFSTTLKENIAYGASGDVTDEEIIEIAKAAQAHEFITSFKKGYDTLVGERGVTLSGGQKQRIAIARAFLTDPKILILDDSASAIDAKTEEKIQKAMDRLLTKRTVFIITHRLATIKRADKIIVLRKGKIVAKGTHDELLRTSLDYRRVFGRHLDLPPLETEGLASATGGNS